MDKPAGADVDSAGRSWGSGDIGAPATLFPLGPPGSLPLSSASDKTCDQPTAWPRVGPRVPLALVLPVRLATEAAVSQWEAVASAEHLGPTLVSGTPLSGLGTKSRGSCIRMTPAPGEGLSSSDSDRAEPRASLGPAASEQGSRRSRTSLCFLLPTQTRGSMLSSA